jgi:hypothetical protein
VDPSNDEGGSPFGQWQRHINQLNVPKKDVTQGQQQKLIDATEIKWERRRERKRE